MKHSDYTVGWICPLPLERAAAIASLDQHHQSLSHESDHNNYALGRIGQHNVAIANLPAGKTGTVSAATVAAQLLKTFPAIRFCLLVGIGGGVPSEKHDIRLGDVVVSSPSGTSGGVIQYDFGKTIETGRFVRTGSLDAPPGVLLNAVAALHANQFLGASEIAVHLAKLSSASPKWSETAAHPGTEHDLLFKADYDHVRERGADTCLSCDKKRLKMRSVRKSTAPVIHYGIIASGNQVMRHGVTREAIAKDQGILCFEMEAAGLMGSFPCLVIRGICDYSDSHKNDMWQPYAAATAAAYATELLNVMPGVGVTGTSTASEVVQQAADFRRQLEFPGMHARKHQIFDAHPHSFDWIWEEQRRKRSFVHWLSSDQKLFWIHGKPGSGKSTLMKYIINDHRTRQYLERGNGESQQREKWTILDFFFDFRAKKELPNNLEGLIRSLLLQFIQKASKSKMNIDMSQELELICDEQRTVPFTVLEQSLRQVLTTSKINICIFLDGLDEYADKYHDLISLILRLVSDGPEWSHSIKFCLASRPEPLLLETLKHYPGFGVQEYNSRSINNYVRQRLQELLPHSMLGPNFQAIISRLTKLANGVFLWASLAVDDTIERYCSGMETPELLKGLDHLPSSLETMYSRMLGRVNREYRYEASVMMQLICYALETLSLNTFITAVRIATNQRLEWDERDMPKFAKRVRALSGGLIEIGWTRLGMEDDREEDLSWAHVRLIHETAGAYLTRLDIFENFSASNNKCAMQPHQLWMFICARVLDIDIITNSRFASRMDHRDGIFSVIHYSSRYLLRHSRNFEEATGSSSISTIDAAMERYCNIESIESEVPTELRCRLIDTPEIKRNDVKELFLREQPKPLALAASAGLLLYCEDKLGHGVDINACECLALSAAIVSGQGDVVTLFIRNGARCEPSHVTAALRNRHHVEITKLLIDRLGHDRIQNGFLHAVIEYSVPWDLTVERNLSFLAGLGLDINSRDEYSNTLLHRVVQQHNTERTLLMKPSKRPIHFMQQFGPDINALNARGWTPFDCIIDGYLKSFWMQDDHHPSSSIRITASGVEEREFMQSLVRQGWKPKEFAQHGIMQQLQEGL